MYNKKTIETWQNSIIKECESRLKRNVTNTEKAFITSRGGFVALEMIEDTIKALKEQELENYLNSESNEH